MIIGKKDYDIFCPLEDCNKEVTEILDMGLWFLFTCTKLHEVLVPKLGTRTETNIRCTEAVKEGFNVCNTCIYKWCKYNGEYEELNPEKVNCPVCGSLWNDDLQYCKKCIEK